MKNSMFSPPVVLLAFVVYVLLLSLLLAFLYFGALQIAFESLGLGRRAVFWVLLMSLFGSSVNIPLTKIKSRRTTDFPEGFPLFRGRFPVPGMTKPDHTVLAINLGGAVIPLVISLYLLGSHPETMFPALLATGVVTLVVHQLAVPVKGVGVTVPLLVPPLIAAAVSILLGSEHAPLLAYVSGTIGTLIGADLLNLEDIAKSGAPMASIGGAGTFDGVFLTGILAVLLASLPMT